MIKLKKLQATCIVLFCICIGAYSQTNWIPEGKFDLYWNDFIKDCRKTQSKLPFKIETSEDKCNVNMVYGNLFAHVSIPFILDGDTTLLGYQRILYIAEVEGSKEEFHTWFDFEAVGMFEHKGYWVIIYTFPLADPNKNTSYTVNTYTKDGKRIDRLPFFKWQCNQSIIEPFSWFEITGYIDDDFEITIQTRGSWDEVSSFGYKKEAAVRAEKEKQLYKVYQINNNGKFEQIDKQPKYIVDDKNNWSVNSPVEPRL